MSSRQQQSSEETAGRFLSTNEKLGESPALARPAALPLDVLGVSLRAVTAPSRRQHRRRTDALRTQGLCLGGHFRLSRVRRDHILPHGEQAASSYSRSTQHVPGMRGFTPFPWFV